MCMRPTAARMGKCWLMLRTCSSRVAAARCRVGTALATGLLTSRLLLAHKQPTTLPVLLLLLLFLYSGKQADVHLHARHDWPAELRSFGCCMLLRPPAKACVSPACPPSHEACGHASQAGWCRKARRCTSIACTAVRAAAMAACSRRGACLATASPTQAFSPLGGFAAAP
jgi:hypothetical protein